jgi:hypothetical protein
MSASQANLAVQLQRARERLAGQGLAEPYVAGLAASLSLRLPGEPAMLLLLATETVPQRVPFPVSANGAAALHASIYAERNDVGAIVVGGGPFGEALADLGGVLPQVFDEQARHLGTMRGPVAKLSGAALADALATGANSVLVEGVPVCMGTTCQRMVFNAELFEKCAKAYVLAASTGGQVTTLPWLVTRIANGRMRKDERRAAERFAQGLLPEESRGY